jgi:hypothetical protein
VRQVFEGAAFAARASAARDENAEQDALEPGLQVGSRLILTFEPQGALEGVLHEVAGRVFAAAEAKGAPVKVGPTRGEVRPHLADAAPR